MRRLPWSLCGSLVCVCCVLPSYDGSDNNPRSGDSVSSSAAGRGGSSSSGGSSTVAGAATTPQGGVPDGVAGEGGTSAGVENGGTDRGGASTDGGTGSGGGGGAGSGGGGGAGGGGPTGGGGAGGSGGGAVGGGGAGGAGGSTAVTPDCSTKFRANITGNHGHVLAIPWTDIAAGATKAYNAQGTSNHPHWVQLTAADFTKLQGGGTVRKLSCDDGHEHEYIVDCISVGMPTETPQKAMYCDAEHKCGLQANYCQTLPDL